MLHSTESSFAVRAETEVAYESRDHLVFSYALTSTKRRSTAKRSSTSLKTAGFALSGGQRNASGNSTNIESSSRAAYGFSECMTCGRSSRLRTRFRKWDRKVTPFPISTSWISTTCLKERVTRKRRRARESWCFTTTTRPAGLHLKFPNTGMKFWQDRSLDAASGYICDFPLREF